MAVMKMDQTSRPANEIQLYSHCKKCLNEKPPNKSLAEWTRLWVGITKDGLQVWCARHNVNVALFEWAEPSDMLNNPEPLRMKCDECDDGKPH